MICIDTNIIIYLAQGRLGIEALGSGPVICPSIVWIEALGYPSIRSVEEQKIRELLATFSAAPLTTTVIELAIKLRQYKKMSLGDAIVAATALANSCALLTANTDDFNHLDELQLVNPLA